MGKGNSGFLLIGLPPPSTKVLVISDERRREEDKAALPVIKLGLDGRVGVG